MKKMLLAAKRFPLFQQQECEQGLLGEQRAQCQLMRKRHLPFQAP
jgi:hypothetical protein